jgi:hypothetical protein
LGCGDIPCLLFVEFEDSRLYYEGVISELRRTWEIGFDDWLGEQDKK